MGITKRIHWKCVCDICGREINLINDKPGKDNAAMTVKYEYIGNKKYACPDCARKINGGT